MRILVAASGGVDSTFCAKYLSSKGHEISLAYMMLHDKPNYHEKNIANVKLVAKHLGSSYHILDFSKDFTKQVFDPFIKSYEAGLTPNPCALCNRFIKFGKLLDFALQNGFKALATGHYVRVKNSLLEVATDPSKDQSYFLANINSNVLKHMIFPLGSLFKSDIKANMAKDPIFKAIATQKESSEICFVDSSYIDVLRPRVKTDILGDVLNSKGEVVGKHEGYMHYTVGKRRGFTMKVAHEPHYVLSINAKQNQITVGLKDELAKTSFELANLNCFLKLGNFLAWVKIRYRQSPVKAYIQILKDDEKAKDLAKSQYLEISKDFLEDKNNLLQDSHLVKTKAYVRLESPVYGVAPGQMAVFYVGDLVVASGFIA